MWPLDRCEETCLLVVFPYRPPPQRLHPFTNDTQRAKGQEWTEAPSVSQEGRGCPVFLSVLACTTSLSLAGSRWKGRRSREGCYGAGCCGAG